jgi:hypothetical protein
MLMAVEQGLPSPLGALKLSPLDMQVRGVATRSSVLQMYDTSVRSLALLRNVCFA